jgi:NitT/TauT family transport system ATP-binding protein
MYISIEGATRTYGAAGAKSSVALDKVDLTIQEGEFICLLGPSGCGKSTLLNLISGFDRPTEGLVRIKGEVVTKPSLERVAIFQNYGLLPWRNVLRNVTLGLEAKGMKLSESRRLAEDYIELVGLSNYKKHHPAQLSGGMQQRVALARALAVDPEILLMDEPLGALDAMTRMSMQDEIERIWQEKKKTIIFVTHDIEEAVFLSDRIVVMSSSPGQIKCIIDVPLARKRDRTGPDFLKIRDRVFAEFELKSIEKTEYFL